MVDDTPSEDGRSDTPRTADLTYEIDEEERPSRAVVRGVASLTDTAVLDLDPLYDTIDPGRLDGLFEEPVPDDRSISFRYAGCHVTVDPRSVRIRRLDD